MADAGTPLIRPGHRLSEASGTPNTGPSPSPSTTTSQLGAFPTPHDYRMNTVSPPDRSRVELSDVGLGLGLGLDGYQIGGGGSHGNDGHGPLHNLPLDEDEDSSRESSRAHRRRSSGALRVVAALENVDGESALARAHHPLLSSAQQAMIQHHQVYHGGHGAAIGDIDGSSSPPYSSRQHPLLSPLGSPEAVVLDMVAHLPPEERLAWIAARWAHAQPEDVFVHSFSFLTPNELAFASLVNRAWCHAAYEPSLWIYMDLSAMYTRVDDAFLTHLLGSNRFIQLRTLILEGCSAITNKSIKAMMYFCPNLREIKLTDCVHITNPWVFVELVKSLPYLKKLELYGVTKEFGIVTPILQVRPKIDLGLFWLEYVAENGIKIDGSGLASCRYEEGADDDAAPAARAAGAHGGEQRGCWGRIKGRIIYANDFYHRGGNYPQSVVYSCQNHAEQDFHDVNYHRCHVCEHLFSTEGASMWRGSDHMICRVCFDLENLQNKHTWIPLDESSIRAFGIGDVISKTIHVASRKNLPVSLRTFGMSAARLDYNLPEPLEDDDEERKRLLHQQHADPTQIPLSTFIDVNGWRLNEVVHTLRGHLQSARGALNTRALLVYDGREDIEVLADKRVILDGREGEEHMQLTVQAWHQALEILYPIIIVMILSIHFSILFYKQTLPIYDGTTNPSAYIRSAGDGSMSPVLVLIIAAIAFVILMICVYLVWRFREACERCFKKFLVADILAIFVFGVATMLWLLVAEWRIYLDSLTFVAIIWNLSMVGLITLYYPMPERLHHFFLILLNTIMAIMLVATLGRWLVLTFLLIFSIGDIISELRNARLLTPFILPANVELLYNTPKILYTVGGLRLRAADLMCFGMMTGLAVATGNGNEDYASVLLGGSFVFIAALSSMAMMLFVAPFLGVRFRPMPLAVMTAFICTMMEDSVFMPFLTQQNNLTVAPIMFQ